MFLDEKICQAALLMSKTLKLILDELTALRSERKNKAGFESSKERNPRAREFDFIQSEHVLAFAHKRTITSDRCRPRIQQLLVAVYDRHSRKTSQRDVAFLQDYTDRFAALRELIRIQFSSMTDIFHKLDRNGTGRLTVGELMDCLTNLHVPWQQVSGLTRVEFTNLVDRQKSGNVDILDFLGAMGLTPRLPWSALPALEQWEEYTNKILELDLLNLEPCKPLWYSEEIAPYRPPSVPSKIVSHQSDVVFLCREDLDFIQTKVRRIEKFLCDFNDNKRELCRLRNDLQNVTEAEERKAESNRRREEEENEQKRLKQEAGLALVMSESGTKRSIFGGTNQRVELSQFKKPNDDELINYFDGIDAHVDPVERRYREFFKKVGLSLFAGDKIRRVFAKHAKGDHVDDESTFCRILAELAGPTVPGTKLRQHWLTASVGGTVSLDVFTFIMWYKSINS